MEIETVPPRKDIPVEHTWNASSVFPKPEAWEAELQAIQASLPEISKYKGRLKDSPVILADALQTADEIIRRTLKVAMYANITQAVDNNDQPAAIMASKAQALFGQVLGVGAFQDPEILEIGLETLRAWVEKEPRLKTYAHYFDNLFRRQAHVRSSEVEEILGLLAEPFSNTNNTANVLTDGELKFKPAMTNDAKEIEVTQGSLERILSKTDRKARQTAWENYRDAYLAYKNTLASNLATSIKQNVFSMRARRHKNTLEASLFENNIPVEVFYNLIETFRKNLPTWHRYFAIRRKALGVDRLQYYDLWAPLTKERPQVTYKQSVEWICAGLAPMGKEYVKTVRDGCLKERWVDIYPNQGKTSGAFSFGSPGTYPFIVMSYTDEIFSLSTLAHELGHSMHSFLTWKNQPIIYSYYSLFVAEVASNFHQAMVRAYMLEKEKDPVFQVAVIEEAMANFLRYFLIMPTLARFELEAHQRIERGEGLNAEGMNELMADLFQEAFGDQVAMDRQRVGITWATFGHLYADYYVYQYATGISAANALSRRILSGTKGAVENYLSFLKAGSSVYPLEALKIAGVDMTSPKPVEETFAILAEYVERLEKVLK